MNDQTPAQIDTRLAELEREDANLTRLIKSAMGDLRMALGHHPERIRTRLGKIEWLYLISAYDAEREAVAIMAENPHAAENVHAAWAMLQELRRDVLVNRAERTAISVEFQRRGGWTRAFSVAAGHIHSSRSCHTCFATTSFYWLPDASGMAEVDIVELAGERACTVCYPSAPVQPRPCRIWSREEVQLRLIKSGQDAAKAAKAAEKAARVITNPDGTPLRGVRGHGILASDVAARNAILQAMGDLLWYGMEHPSSAAWIDLSDRALAALAHKHGRDLIELRNEYAAKAEVKHARELKASR